MRTIAVSTSLDREWENLVTSLIVSEKTVDEVKSLQGKLPQIKNNQIALFLNAIPFDYSVFEGFCQGDIGQSRLTIMGNSYAFGSRHIMTKQFDPLKLKVTSSRRRIEGLPKRVLRAVNLNGAPEREGLWAIAQSQTGLPKKFCYADMNDLIEETLGITDLNHTTDFELLISNLAKVKSINFNPSSFVVEISKIIGLKNLQLNVFQGRSKNGGEFYTVWRKGYSINEIESLQPSETVSVTVQPPDLFPFDLITIELIHGDSSLTIDETWERAPLQNLVEPYFKTLDAFCPIAELREMLLNPEKSPKKPEERFENVVSWLLSLAGFQTIYLGAKIRVAEKEHLVSFDVLRNKGGYEIGCADIIAYEDNQRVLVVDCDIGGLDEKKIQRLVETCNYLQNIYCFKELKVVPVLFSPRNFGEAAKNKPVAIVDGAVIESILEEIAKGDRKSARSKISVNSL